MEITQQLASRVHQIRTRQGLSIEALAERSGVSKSSISLIESGMSNPTATVLDKLATGLNVVLASLFEQDGNVPREQHTVSRSVQQSSWTDPASGYLRRNLSPPNNAWLKLVEVSFPAGQRVAYETGERHPKIHQQIWIIEGEMHITLGHDEWSLATGDCLAIQLNQPIIYRNVSTRPARYLVAIADPETTA